MADPLRKPLDADLGADSVLSRPELPTASEEFETPPIPGERKTTLANTAENVGTAVGSAVGTIRNKVHAGLEVVKRRSTSGDSTAEDVTQTVRERAGEIAGESRRRVREWTNAAQRRSEELRRHAREFSRERPAELILAIGGVALIAGILLRLWRSNRD